MYRQKMIIAILAICCGLIANGLGIVFTALPSYAVPDNNQAQSLLHQNSQPDLIIESITLNPTTLSPDAEGNITGKITAVIKNQGDVASGGYHLHLYVDPEDMPPNQTTAETFQTSFGLGISAGLTNQWQRDVAFTTVNPVIYVWIDRDDDVAEADENNNLLRYPELVETPTNTPVYTATPTDMPPTNTATATYTSTAPPTRTSTVTSTDTAIPTNTATPTETETATDAPTETLTATSDPYMPTSTPTSSTYPQTPDVTVTSDKTVIPTLTPDDTVTPTATSNNNTPVAAPTDTFTPAPTDTVSSTPPPGSGDGSKTPTPTLSPTAIISPTPTSTVDPCVAAATGGPLPSSPGGQNADQPHRVFLPVTSNGSPMIAPTVSSVNVLEPSVTEVDARATSEPLRISETSIDLIEFPNGLAPTDGSVPNARFRTNFEGGITPPGPTFEIWVTDDGLPTVMRDDGCGGDEIEGDGIYTAEVVLSQEELDLVSISKNPLERIDPTDTIDIFKELMIVKSADGRDDDTMSVVDDPERTFDLCNARGNPDGVWAFKTLIMNMANTDDEAVAADFVEDWWRTWGEEITLSNGHSAEGRSEVIDQILAHWERDGDKLDLDAAPFRLLAIVTRLDLRNDPTPTTGHAGEFRFVWAVLEPEQPCAETREFTIIFEYAMPAENTTDLLEWAHQIHALQDLAFGPDYNEALEAISTQITGRNVMPDELNGSAINQVRSNEFRKEPWELREFVLSEDELLAGTETNRLMVTTVKQTPDEDFNNTAEMADFINENSDALLHKDPVTGFDSPLHTVPDELLGASSIAEFSPWRVFPNKGTINDNEARHQFALMTCNGCHTLETGTAFLHVQPRPHLVETVLSRFLTDEPHPDGRAPTDPVTGVERDFNDLKRRQDDLLRILHSTRFEIVGMPGLRSRVH